MPTYESRLAKLEAMRPAADANYKLGFFEYDANNRSIGGTFDGQRFERLPGETRQEGATRFLESIGFQGNAIWVDPARSKDGKPVPVIED